MKHKIIFLIIAILLASPSGFPMNEQSQEDFHREVEELVDSFAGLTLYDGDFSMVPIEVVRSILFLAQCEFPGKEFVRIVKFRRVCKRWLGLLVDLGKLAEYLQIPSMHLAALMGDVEKILDLKLLGYSHREPDCHNYTPAHYAIANKKYRIAKILGIGCAFVNPETCKQLCDFVQDNDEQMLLLLAYHDRPDQDYNPDALEELKKIACNGDVLEFEDALLQYWNNMQIFYLTGLGSVEGIGPQDISEEKWVLKRMMYALACDMESMLFGLIKNGDFVVMGESRMNTFFKTFQQFGSNPNACNEIGYSLLQKTCFDEENEPILSGLLECKGIDVNKKSTRGPDETALHIATAKRNIKAVQMLLALKDEKGEMIVDVNAGNVDGTTSLHLAVLNKDIVIADLLLKHGADVNKKEIGGVSPFYYAIGNDDDVTMLKFLISTGKCDLETQDNQGYTPLEYAVSKNNSSCINILLQWGARTYYRDDRGESLLHNAARGNAESLQELLPYMFREINSPSKTGLRPLHLAARYSTVCANLLLDQGAEIDALSLAGETPLHYAASFGNVDCIKLLVGRGAFIDSALKDDVLVGSMHYGGFTPLHFAIYKKHFDAVKTLIHLGADVTLTTAQGKTVLELANESGDEQIIRYIKKLM